MHTVPVPKDQLRKTVSDADTWASGPALLSIPSVDKRRLQGPKDKLHMTGYDAHVLAAKP